MMLYAITTVIAIGALSSAYTVQNALPLGSSFGLAGQNASFDYVVVGGGTAGNTLAYRLAADGRFSVAVIEAGSFYEIDNGNRSVIPGYALQPGPLVDWGFETTPQTTLGIKIQPYTRGRCLGGSSARNLMVYQRPTIGTMQKWANEVGDQSWRFNETLKYYKRSSTFTSPVLDPRTIDSTPAWDASVYGKGPLQVSFANYISPITPSMLSAYHEAGDPVARDGFSSGSLLGHSYIPSSIEPSKQERSSSQSSYLNLALQRSQLTVYTHSLAKKILFDEQKTATGVQIESSGLPFFLRANKEVIVSAGAFQSPQLLMVSGIGPASKLESLSIPVIKDAPGVGQNLQDNPLFGISFAVNKETNSLYRNDPARMAEAIADYNEHQKGYLTSAVDVVSFEKLRDMSALNISNQAQKDLSSIPEDWPDVQIFGFATYVGATLATPAPDKKNYATFLGSVIAPLSRGSVSILSPDMADPPLIDPEWLTHPTDQELAVAAMRRARQFLDTEAMRQVNPSGEAFPGSNVTSYKDLLAVVRSQTGTFYHASCTCKMGKENDEMAIVDSHARVYGVRNLRVVDASAFPFLPPGQPQATVYMFAEKIADDVLRTA